MGRPYIAPSPTATRRRPSAVAAAAVALALLGAACDLSDPSLATTLITDPGAGPAAAVHDTVGEPDVLVDGSTQIAVAETGLITDPNAGGATEGLRPAGAAGIGLAVSTDAGATWRPAHLTVPAGYGATQPRLARDARHGRYLLSAHLYAFDGPTGLPRPGVGLWSSPDGVTWQAQALPDELRATLGRVAPVACDNVAASPTYGTCYAGFLTRTVVAGLRPVPQTSLVIGHTTDGGSTWSVLDRLVYPGGPVTLTATPDNLLVAHVEGGSVRQRIRMVAPTGTEWHDVLTVAARSATGTVELAASVDGQGRSALAWNSCAAQPDCARDDIVVALPLAPQSPQTSLLPRSEDQAEEHRTRPRIALDPTAEGGVAVGYLAATGGEPGTVRAVVHKAASARSAASIGGRVKSWNRDELTAPMGLDWFPLRPGAPASPGTRLVGPVAVALRGGGTVVPVYQVAEAPYAFGRLSVRIATITDPPGL